MLSDVDTKFDNKPVRVQLLSHIHTTEMGLSWPPSRQSSLRLVQYLITGNTGLRAEEIYTR